MRISDWSSDVCSSDLLPCLLLAACLYRGNIDDPMTIKATWLSYLNGDDMRAACVEGAPLQYRLIYNADYDEQLRSYEVTGTPGSAGDAGGGRLVVRVLGRRGIAGKGLTFSDPLEIGQAAGGESMGT